MRHDTSSNIPDQHIKRMFWYSEADGLTLRSTADARGRRFVIFVLLAQGESGILYRRTFRIMLPQRSYWTRYFALICIIKTNSKQQLLWFVPWMQEADAWRRAMVLLRYRL